MKDLILAVLKDAGHLSLKTVEAELSASSVQDLFRRANMIFRSGHQPYEGGEWLHVCEKYVVGPDDTKSEILRKRQEALARLVYRFDVLYSAGLPLTILHPEGKDYRTVVLKGQWLKETVMDDAVYIDCSVAFGHKYKVAFRPGLGYCPEEDLQPAEEIS